MRLLCVLLACLAFAAPPLRAQPGAEDRSARLAELFSDMSLHTGLRVTTPALFIDQGTFEGLLPDVVEIGYAGGLVPVALSDIRTVQVEGRHPIQGMLWGIGAGALVGSVSGMLVASFNCRTPSGCRNSEREGAWRWGTFFGTLGGLGGFIIGRYVVTWHPIFP